jgi:hypothetical protein
VLKECCIWMSIKVLKECYKIQTHFHKCEKVSFNTPKWFSHFNTSWHLIVFWIFRIKMHIINNVQIGHSLNHWKDLEVQILEMSSHCSFECLKFKLWTKERLGIKLTIWFLIIQTQEIGVKCLWNRTCDIMLWSSLQRLKVFFIKLFNLNSYTKNYKLAKLRDSQLSKIRNVCDF